MTHLLIKAVTLLSTIRLKELGELVNLEVHLQLKPHNFIERIKLRLHQSVLKATECILVSPRLMISIKKSAKREPSYMKAYSRSNDSNLIKYSCISSAFFVPAFMQNNLNVFIFNIINSLL